MQAHDRCRARRNRPPNWARPPAARHQRRHDEALVAAPADAELEQLKAVAEAARCRRLRGNSNENRPEVP